MNTLIDLLYNGGGGKARDQVILTGEISQAQIIELQNALADGMSLIAEEVGLPTPSLQLTEEFDFPTAEDHVLTTLEDFDDVIPRAADLLTSEPATTDMTPAQLLEAINNAPWDYLSEMERLGIPEDENQDLGMALG